MNHVSLQSFKAVHRLIKNFKLEGMKLTGLMKGADMIEAAVAAMKPGSPVSPVIVV